MIDQPAGQKIDTGQSDIPADCHPFRPILLNQPTTRRSTKAVCARF